MEYLTEWMKYPVFQDVTTLFLGLVVLFFLIRVLKKSVVRIEDAGTRYRTRKFISIFGYIAAFVLAAGLLSDSFGQLTVAFGVAGAGIAFALQEVIASVAGWFAIIFGGFYRTGDRVQLGGIRGDVIDIGVLRTTLMECGEWINGDQYNGRIVRVANSFVFKEPVFNYSVDFPFLWDEIILGVRYGSDYGLAKEILQRVGNEVVGNYTASAKETWESLVRKYRIEKAVIDPTVTVVANSNWMEYTLRYIVDYRLRRRIKDQLFTRIIEEIDRVGGRVAIASASIELARIPSLQVQVAGEAG